LKDITLIISTDVVKKIIASNIKTGKKSEWIGILFYQKIDAKTLKAIDICYMGKGPENSMVASIDYSVYPELSSVLSNYVMNNADKIMDCYQGLIHSHIEMGTSPSSVDMSELMTNNSNYNGTYLSVICNHKMEFTSLVSIEQEQPTVTHKYKWFGEVVNRDVEPIKDISIYSINTVFDIEEYADIDEALNVISKATSIKKLSKGKLNMYSQQVISGWDNIENDYLDDLNEYFEFSLSDSYMDKIAKLNNYTSQGLTVDMFIKAIGEPFQANVLLKELSRFSHTKFYKDLKSYIEIFKLGYDEL